MAHAKEAHVEDNIQIGDEASAFGKKAMGVGGASLVLALVLGGGPFGQQFQASYLVAFMYVLALGLGSLWFVTIQHLTNAKWSVVVRRVAEIHAANMAVVFGLSLLILLPMLTGQSALYVWLDHAKVEASHTLHHKASYVNLPVVLARFACYFGGWGLLSRRVL
jgi:hypothetical protein